MSDLFISEILILSLLVIVLLRPFFRSFQRLDGIALLPLLTLAMAIAIIAGLGIRISFLPVFLFVLLVFLAGLSRLFRLFFHLPTDWYSPLATVVSGFFLALLAGILFVSWSFAPEPAYIAAKPIQRTVFMHKVSHGIEGRYTIYAPINSAQKIQDRPVVLLTGDISSGSGSRNTTAWILAENGYTVIEADFRSKSDYASPALFFPVFRKFSALSGKIATGSVFFTDEQEINRVHEKELNRLIHYVHKEYGSSMPLFALAEGSSAPALITRVTEDPGLFTGSVCILQDSDVLQSVQIPGGFLGVTVDSGMMPSNAGAFPLLAVTGEPALLPGFGELGSDDVLAAFFLGAGRDSGRRTAELTGRRILTWLSLRRDYEI